MQHPRNCLCFSTSVVIVDFLFLLACSLWRRCIWLFVPASSCTWQAYQGSDQVAGRASSWLEYCHLFANVSVLETCLDSATYLLLISLSGPLAFPPWLWGPSCQPHFLCGSQCSLPLPPSTHALPLSSCCPRAILLLTQAGVISRGPKPLWAFLFSVKWCFFLT